MTKLAVSIDEAAELASLSKSRLYELFKSGDIIPRKQGAKTLILVSDLKAFLEGLPVASQKEAA